MTSKISGVELDFLSLAAWDLHFYANAHAILRGNIRGEWKHSHWLQYSGFRSKTTFVGKGTQSGRGHYIARMSGSDSHLYHNEFLHLDCYATRIDLQVTIPSPRTDVLQGVKERCSRSTVTLIDGYENDTLYIGNRQSDFFVRLYEKILDRVYLRLEFELKGDRSRALWSGLQDDSFTLEGAYDFYLAKSGLPDDIKELFIMGDSVPSARLMREQRTVHARRKLEWVQNVDSAILNAMSDHEIGEDIKAIVRSWALYADRLDKM